MNVCTVGTRFFDKKDPQRFSVIEQFVSQARSLVPNVLVAVNNDEDVTNTVARLNSLGILGVEAFSVSPWGRFLMPLNALALKAASHGSYLLIVSADIKITSEIINTLEGEMTEDTLVVGGALDSHDLGIGAVAGNGVTVPWHTLALWNLKYLTRTGFSMLEDAPFDPQQSGIGELATIAVLQRLYPNLRAVLMKVPGISLEIAGWSQERLEHQKKKLASKISRGEAVLKFLGLERPIVVHINNS